MKQYQEPDMEIIEFEMNQAIAEGSGVEDGFTTDGDTMSGL